MMAPIIVVCMKSTASIVNMTIAGRENIISDNAMPNMYMNALVGELTTMSCTLKSFLRWERSA